MAIATRNLKQGLGTEGSGAPLVHEIFTKINNAKDKPKKIEVLRSNDSPAIRSLLKAAFVFLNRDLKRNISSSMRTNTPDLVSGLSMQFCLIHGNDFCCPHVVGILKGTGDFAHFRTR